MRIARRIAWPAFWGLLLAALPVELFLLLVAFPNHPRHHPPPPPLPVVQGLEKSMDARRDYRSCRHHGGVWDISMTKNLDGFRGWTTLITCHDDSIVVYRTRTR